MRFSLSIFVFLFSAWSLPLLVTILAIFVTLLCLLSPLGSGHYLYRQPQALQLSLSRNFPASSQNQPIYLWSFGPWHSKTPPHACSPVCYLPTPALLRLLFSLTIVCDIFNVCHASIWRFSQMNHISGDFSSTNGHSDGLIMLVLTSLTTDGHVIVKNLKSVYEKELMTLVLAVQHYKWAYPFFISVF